MQYPVHKKKCSSEERTNLIEIKVKRSFPFEEDSEMSNQIKKFKARTNQVPNIMESSSISKGFMKHSKIPLETLSEKRVSLAEKMRPMSIANYIGQKQIIGPGTVLRRLLEKREIPSMIFWGPPGCGKTSLTNVIECLSKETTGNNIHIVRLSAANSGVKNVRDAVTTAQNKSKFGYKTVVIMDKIHCFNKLQQDIFLPHVEAGTITLIGCTTENPSYSLNPALLSRCRVFMLYKLMESNIKEILHKAIGYINENVFDTGGENHRDHTMFYPTLNSKFHIDKETLQWLSEACDGDAHVALNTLELAVLAKEPDKLRTSCNNDFKITVKDVRKYLIQTHLLSDEESSQSHHIYSALHKSIRAGKVNASLYWMARIMAAKEDPVNIARRLVRISSEDIGLADPDALGIAVHTMHGCQMIGMPECDVLLGQCTVYLAKAPKSRSVYNALKAAEKIILECKGPQPNIPLHMRLDSREATKLHSLDCST
ncbi:ATPase WRNIP1 [Harpegnathos saltator]|uniref:ATPase WRNIP1 n=1 Tax=Harpegnathos saltator TaxID=610380 RepID=UPI00058EF21C|nr:ATPase WRNIP1 [Harpegnathos saltator]